MWVRKGVIKVYKYVCEYCGAYLDPGEKCDCEEERKRKNAKYQKMVYEDKKTSQLTFCLERRK